AFSGSFYVEVQRPYMRGDARRNAALADLAELLRVPLVATGDVHAHHLRRARLQDALVAIRCRTSLDGCERERRGNHESVLVSPQEMAERFPGDADAVARTAELVERLQFDLTQELGYRYPDFSDGEEPASVQLRRLCEPAVHRSLGRFLNRELVSVPDIDLGFRRDIREKLIVRVTERYGHEHAALVASFATYRARGAIRDVGKALGLPFGELERLARVSDG